MRKKRESFGPAISALRDRAGLSQAEFAERVGIHPITVSNLERDKLERPSVQLLRSIALEFPSDEPFRQFVTRYFFGA